MCSRLHRVPFLRPFLQASSSPSSKSFLYAPSFLPSFRPFFQPFSLVLPFLAESICSPKLIPDTLLNAIVVYRSRSFVRHRSPHQAISSSFFEGGLRCAALRWQGVFKVFHIYLIYKSNVQKFVITFLFAFYLKRGEGRMNIYAWNFSAPQASINLSPCLQE